MVKKIAFICIALILFCGSAFAEIIPSARKIDWTYAGIPGGIPSRTTICATIDAGTYGGGDVNATTTIQAALDACPSGQVVYVPAGTYQIDTYLRMRSNVTLRGAGQGITTLKAGGSARNQLIYFYDAYIYDEIVGSPTTYNITSAVKDSLVVSLNSVSGISVGDLLLLNQLNDGTEVTNLGWAGGSPTTCTFCGIANGTRSLGQVVEVSAVNGLDVSTTVPLHWTIDVGLTPLAYRLLGSHMLRWAGLEDMTLTQDTGIVEYLVQVNGAQYCWVKNVEIINTKAIGIFTYYAIQSDFSGNYLHDYIGIGNSLAYGFSLSFYSSNNLIYNNIIHNMSNGGIETHGGASGNVVAYNYLHDILFYIPTWLIDSPALAHGAYPKMNLWENNIGYMAQGDDIWGSSGYNTIFRSRSFGYLSDTVTANNAAIRLSGLTHYYNIVGSVLGTTGKSDTYEVHDGQVVNNASLYVWVLGKSSQGAPDDTLVRSTVYRHGNYDYVTNSTIWDPGIGDHVIPASLYLSLRPDWWCAETPWPPIGPDVAGLSNTIPAKIRYDALTCTPLAAGPVISSITSTSSNTSAVITWITDELADSHIHYGLTAGYGSEVTLDATLVTSHGQQIINLSPNTLYHYAVISKDAAANSTTSGDGEFTTVGNVSRMRGFRRH